MPFAEYTQDGVLLGRWPVGPADPEGKHRVSIPDRQVDALLRVGEKLALPDGEVVIMPGELRPVVGAASLSGVHRGLASPPLASRSGTFAVTGSFSRQSTLSGIDGSADDAEDPGAHSTESVPQIPGYEFIEQIGRGSMGTVWRACQLSTSRQVALKVTSGDLTGLARQRFILEVEVTAKLDHPHICKLYDSGLDKGLAYYVMELVEGEDLGRHLFLSKPAERGVVELLARVCEAVGHAHQRGVIHRDLKPGNILVAADGQPKVVDFGLAKIHGEVPVEEITEHSSGVTVDGRVLGTPAYMSPEQARGEHGVLDTRSDVYSLGVILYEAVCGQHPHGKGSAMEMIARVITSTPRPPRDIRPAIHPDLQAIMLRALAGSPADRYGTAGELAADLRRYLKGEPTTARPPGSGELLVRWARQHPAITLMSLAIVLGLALGLIVNNSLYRQAEASRIAAVNSERQARKSEQEAERQKAFALGSEQAALAARDQARSARETAQAAQIEAMSQRGLAEGLLYFTRIALANTAIRDGDANTTRELLQSCRDLMGGQARLGWEWHYLARLQDASIARFEAHNGPVLDLTLSPDGLYAASAGGGDPYHAYRRSGPTPGDVAIWDLNAGQRVHSIPARFTSAAGVVVSAARPEIYFSELDGQIHRVNLTTGDLTTLAKVTAPLALPVAPSPRLRISPDGRWLVMRCEGGTALINTETGQSTTSPWGHWTFSPDGRYVACLTEDHDERHMKIYDANGFEPNAQPLRALPILNADNLDPRFSPDSSRIYALTAESSFVVSWDIHTAEQRIHTDGNAGTILDFSILPDGRLLTAGVDHVLRVWRMKDTQGLLRPVQEAHYNGHNGPIMACAVWADGRLAATAAMDTTLRVWPLDINPRHYTWDSGQTYSKIATIGFSADGKSILCVTNKGIAQQHATLSGRRLRSIPIGDEAPAEWPRADFALCGRSERLARASTDRRSLHVLDLASPDQPILTIQGPGYGVQCAALSANGRVAAAAFAIPADGRLLPPDQNSVIRVQAVAGNSPSLDIPLGSTSIRAIALSPDGSLLAYTFTEPTRRQRVSVRRTDSAAEIALFDQAVGINFLAFSPNAQHLAAADNGGQRIYCWDLRTATLLFERVAPNAVSHVSFSPDGTRLAAAGYDVNAHLWALPAGNPIFLLNSETPSPGSVGFTPRIIFSPDGDRIAMNHWTGEVTVFSSRPISSEHLQWLDEIRANAVDPATQPDQTPGSAP